MRLGISVRSQLYRRILCPAEKKIRYLSHPWDVTQEENVGLLCMPSTVGSFGKYSSTRRHLYKCGNKAKICKSTLTHRLRLCHRQLYLHRKVCRHISSSSMPIFPRFNSGVVPGGQGAWPLQGNFSNLSGSLKL